MANISSEWLLNISPLLIISPTRLPSTPFEAFKIESQVVRLGQPWEAGVKVNIGFLQLWVLILSMLLPALGPWGNCVNFFEPQFY